VQILELYFPQSIDRLFKEGSMKQGLRPIVLQPVDARLLTKFLTGAIATETGESPQFGCS
jgi:hypothetical protein